MVSKSNLLFFVILLTGKASAAASLLALQNPGNGGTTRKSGSLIINESTKSKYQPPLELNDPRQVSIFQPASKKFPNRTLSSEIVDEMVRSVMDMDPKLKVSSQVPNSENNLLRKILDGSLVVITQESNSTHGREENVEEKIVSGGVFPPITKNEISQLSCQVNGSIYESGEMVKTSHPCQHCQCHHGRVSCYVQQCDGSPDFNCVPLFVPGSCCPIYSCAKN